MNFLRFMSKSSGRILGTKREQLLCLCTTEKDSLEVSIPKDIQFAPTNTTERIGDFKLVREPTE